jgi:hypothetical protein
MLGVAGAEPRVYDLLAVAAGINTPVLAAIERLGLGYHAPRATAAYIAEFRMGAEAIQSSLGTSMHVLLLNMPQLEFAAIVPKGEFASVCLLGRGINDQFFQEFLRHPRVRGCFPPGWEPPAIGCHCSPRMQVRGARRPYADRVVFVGDAGTGRLFKDGIGSAYRTAKAAAATAVFEGISARHFRRYFLPLCRKIERDNLFGQLVFLVTREIQRRRFNRRGVMRMTSREQSQPRLSPRMSGVLWDTFTGSSSYSDIFRRALHPIFIARLIVNVLAGGLVGTRPPAPREPLRSESYPSANSIGETHVQRFTGQSVRTRRDHSPAGG